MAMSKKQIKDAKASQTAKEKKVAGRTKQVKIYGGKKYSAEQKEEAIRTYNNARGDYRSKIATARYVSEILNIGCPETVIEWVKQSQVDLGNESGLTTSERQELFKLRRENKEMQRAIDILKKASALLTQDYNPLSRI
jgi:transposase